MAPRHVMKDKAIVVGDLFMLLTIFFWPVLQRSGWVILKHEYLECSLQELLLLGWTYGTSNRCPKVTQFPRGDADLQGVWSWRLVCHWVWLMRGCGHTETGTCTWISSILSIAICTLFHLCCMCVILVVFLCATIQIWRSEDGLVLSLPYVGSEDWTQVVSLFRTCLYCPSCPTGLKGFIF